MLGALHWRGGGERGGGPVQVGPVAQSERVELIIFMGPLYFSCQAKTTMLVLEQPCSCGRPELCINSNTAHPGDQAAVGCHLLSKTKACKSISCGVPAI